MTNLKDEIKQTQPFRSVHEEVALALARTTDLISFPLSEVLKSADLTPSQYNVLRILRGAGAEGLACGEISSRMVRRDPDLTRLLDRLEARGLVRRARGTADRRVVLATITEEGTELLGTLDEPVEKSLETALAHVPEKRLRELLAILENVRSR